jgi:hypothetical protein
MGMVWGKTVDGHPTYPTFCRHLLAVSSASNQKTLHNRHYLIWTDDFQILRCMKSSASFFVQQPARRRYYSLLLVITIMILGSMSC